MIIEDVTGNPIFGLMLGQVERGDIIGPFPVVLFNEKNKSANNVLIKGEYSRINQRGLPMDTVESTFISLDGVDAYPEQMVNIPAGGRVMIYLHFQPTWIALPGAYQWSLLVKEFD